MTNHTINVLLHDDKPNNENGYRNIATFNIDVENVTDMTEIQVLETVYCNTQNAFSNWITDTKFNHVDEIDSVSMQINDYNTKDAKTLKYVPAEKRVDGVEYYKFSRSSMIGDVFEMNGEYHMVADWGFVKLSEEVFEYLATLTGRQVRDLDYIAEKNGGDMTDVAKLKKLLKRYYSE